MDKLLINNNYPDLDGDFERWDAYIAALRQSDHLPYFLSSDMGEQWDRFSNPVKEKILGGFATSHEEIFNYAAMPISMAADYGAGFWATVLQNPDETIESVDGTIAMPVTGNDESLQMLVYSLARNVLLQRFVDGDIDHTPFHQEFKDYNTTFGRLADERTRLAIFPMPSQFDEWINRPSMRYGLQAASYVSGQLSGNKDIDQNLIERLRMDFMTEQRDILAMLLNVNKLVDEGELYKMFWQERAQDYVDVVIGDPDRFPAKEALRVIQVAKRSGIEIKEPDKLREILAIDPNLRAMHIATREEAIHFTSRIDHKAFDQLTPIVRLHLLSTLGPQEELNGMQRMDCDIAAVNILSSWPLHESYLAHYTALFNEMGHALREKQDLNRLGSEWLGGCDLDTKIAFLVSLNEHASTHLGIDAVPVLSFSKPMMKREDGEVWKKDAAAFAMPYANGEFLRKEYGMEIPAELNGWGIIGINTHDDFGSLSAPTPIKASRSIIHEIAHHVVYKEVADDLMGNIASDDPRYSQIKEYRLIDGYGATDRRLREEFSNAVYPLIQTEKFQYWVMNAFIKARPFGFMDTNPPEPNCHPRLSAV